MASSTLGSGSRSRSPRWRTRARTGRPSATSREASSPPTNPVAPVIRVLSVIASPPRPYQVTEPCEVVDGRGGADHRHCQHGPFVQPERTQPDRVRLGSLWLDE